MLEFYHKQISKWQKHYHNQFLISLQLTNFYFLLPTVKHLNCTARSNDTYLLFSNSFSLRIPSVPEWCWVSYTIDSLPVNIITPCTLYANVHWWQQLYQIINYTDLTKGDKSDKPNYIWKWHFILYYEYKNYKITLKVSLPEQRNWVWTLLVPSLLTALHSYVPESSGYAYRIANVATPKSNFCWKRWPVLKRLTVWQMHIFRALRKSIQMA